MITIKISSSKITVSGHALAEAKGKDLVCAGVSAIILSAINWFNKKEINLTVNDEQPLVAIELIKKSKENKYLIELIGIQLKAIAKDNKKYICLK